MKLSSPNATRRRGVVGLVLVVLLLVGCGRTAEVDRVLSRSMELLDGAAALLEKHAGDQAAAEGALRGYLAKNRVEARALHVRGKELVAALTAEEKTAFEARAKSARLERQTRLENLARTFEKPKEILAIVRHVN